MGEDLCGPRMGFTGPDSLLQPVLALLPFWESVTDA